MAWLRGRCLAYGEGVGFWPLEQIVKGHLGLTETDTAAQALLQLERAVAGMPDAPWLRARLAPLIGLPGESADRDEVFAAWERLFSEVAAKRPLVLEVEDLHWAHPAMLAFVEYLAEWSIGVPLLILCTARPELFEQYPRWAGGLATATTLTLRPLTTEDTVRLAEVLLWSVTPASDVQAALVARCGGNPLYAEEYARLLAERSTEAAREPEMPETVQAVIAARIDTLPRDRKDVLHDAAVIGKVFWAGAVAALGGGDPAQRRRELHELARKELVRRSRISSLPGDEEYLFWHDLVHEVAYRQIPRRNRAIKHQRTAEWIEHTAGSRLGDRAELVAHHYQQALELVRASGEGDPEPLRLAAIRALRLAGDRALGIDAAHAEQVIEDGLLLAAADDPDRGPLLCLRGQALFNLGRHAEALDALNYAARTAEESGDIQTMGTALVYGFQSAWIMGQTEDARHMLDLAVQRLQEEPPTPRLSLALAWSACRFGMADDWDRALSAVDQAINVGEIVDDRLGVALAYVWRGLAHAAMGESDGADDLRRGSTMLADLGSSLAPQGRIMRLARRSFGTARRRLRSCISRRWNTHGGSTSRFGSYKLWAS